MDNYKISQKIYSQFGGKARNMKKIDEAQRRQKVTQKDVDYTNIKLKKVKRNKKQKPTKHMDYSKIVLKKINKKVKSTKTRQPLPTSKQTPSKRTTSKPTKHSQSAQKKNSQRASPAPSKNTTSPRKTTKTVTRIFFTSQHDATPNTMTSRSISIPLFQSHCEAISTADTLYASISMSISDAIATEYEIAAPVTEYSEYGAAADEPGGCGHFIPLFGTCALGQTHSPQICYFAACPDDEDVVYYIANGDAYVKGEDIYSEVALPPLPIDARCGSASLPDSDCSLSMLASDECSDDDLLRNVGDALKKMFL